MEGGVRRGNYKRIRNKPSAISIRFKRSPWVLSFPFFSRWSNSNVTWMVPPSGGIHLRSLTWRNETTI